MVAFEPMEAPEVSSPIRIERRSGYFTPICAATWRTLMANGSCRLSSTESDPCARLKEKSLVGSASGYDEKAYIASADAPMNRLENAAVDIMLRTFLMVDVQMDSAGDAPLRTEPNGLTIVHTWCVYKSTLEDGVACQMLPLLSLRLGDTSFCSQRGWHEIRCLCRLALQPKK